MLTQELVLTPELRMRAGRYRTCYQHPTVENWVVKVQHAGAFDKQKEMAPHLRELSFYQKITALWAFPVFIGAQPTNLGLGLIFEKIQNEDGSPAQRLADFYDTHHMLPLSVYRSLMGLLDELDEANLLSCAANMENILLVQRQGELVALSCDTKEIMTRRFWDQLSFFKTRKVRRRHKRLREFYKGLLKAPVIS